MTVFWVYENHVDGTFWALVPVCQKMWNIVYIQTKWRHRWQPWYFASVFLFISTLYSFLNKITFIRDKLINIGLSIPPHIKLDFSFSPGYLNILVTSGAQVLATRCTRTQGKHSGALVRLHQRGLRTPVLSIFLTNLHSLYNKIDKLELERTFPNRLLSVSLRPGCVSLSLTACCNWMDYNSSEATGKTNGGKICFCIEDGRGNNVMVLLKYCSPELESFFKNYKPFHSPTVFVRATQTHCYVTIKSYCSATCAAMSLSDHCLIHLIPTYRQKLRCAKPVVRIVKRWTRWTKGELHWLGCFQRDINRSGWVCRHCIILCQFVWGQLHPHQVKYNNDKPWFAAEPRMRPTGVEISTSTSRPSTSWREEVWKMVVPTNASAPQRSSKGAIICSTVCPRRLPRITYNQNMLFNIRTNYTGKTDEFWCDMEELREFTIVFVVAVYIAPCANAKANAKEALWGLHDAINEL